MKIYRFDEIVQINPKVPLIKGENYDFIPMEDVNPEKKNVYPKGQRTLKGGGARFCENDIIFARITPCLEHGKIAFVPKLETTGAFGSTEYIVFRPKEKKIDNHYLYYLSKSETITRPAIKSMVGASGRQRAQKEAIADIKIALPPLPTQKRIADILSAYDDLIENNNRRIALLEQAARHLYKEWFVRFKFPGHEKVKIVDGIPEGWERRTLGEVCECIGGGTPSTSKSEFWDNGVIEWFVPKDLTNNNSLILLGSDRKITPLGLQKSSAKMLPKNTILMTSRASIGFFGIFDNPCCTNQGFISLIPNDEHFRWYFLYNLMFRKYEIISNAGGTTFKEINKTAFRGMDILIPKKKFVLLFNEFVSITLAQTKILVKKNQNLKLLRDLLLPKLMNGDVQV